MPTTIAARNLLPGDMFLSYRGDTPKMVTVISVSKGNRNYQSDLAHPYAYYVDIHIVAGATLIGYHPMALIDLVNR